MWEALLIRAVIIIVVASVIRYLVRRAPDSTINAEFKAVLNWGVLIVALVLLLFLFVRLLSSL